MRIPSRLSLHLHHPAEDRLGSGLPLREGNARTYSCLPGERQAFLQKRQIIAMKLMLIGICRRPFVPTGSFCRLSSDIEPVVSWFFALAR
jgi:hypothetical protein